MNDFLFNLSRVLAHSIVYETCDVPDGVKNDFINGLGFGMDFFAGLAEGKPDIPAFTPINVQEEQGKAIAGNIKQLPQLEKLGGEVNRFNAEQMQKMLKQMIPNYDAIVSGASGNIDSLLKGIIPDDVSDAVQRSGAAKAIGGGFAGTGMNRNLVARDLGLTSLDLTSKGLDSASRWLTTMGALTQPNMFNFSSMFVTPEFQVNTAMSERDSKFQHDYVSNLNDWQHSTGYLWGQDMRNTGNTISSLLSSYLGGGMGGGGAKG